MISYHVSAVCCVRDGYTGRTVETSGLLCTLDGMPYRPVTKSGGYLVLVNLTPGPHRLTLRGNGFQEELVELTAHGGTQELDVTLKPGERYPFRQTVTQLCLTLTEGEKPAADRSLWVAAGGGAAELKIAQTKAEAGSQRFRIYCKLPPSTLPIPGAFLIVDGKESEVVSLRALEGEEAVLAAPLLRDHGRSKVLLPAQRFHTDGEGKLMAVFREPCTAELYREEGGLLASLKLEEGENRQSLTI